MPRDFRISRAHVANAEPDAFFWALVEPTWPAIESEDCPEHLIQATPGQRALYSTMLFAREVDNGGLEQLLWNMEPWFIELAEEGLRLLGANHYAAALCDAAIAFFGTSPPLDLTTRRELIDSKDRSWLDAVIEPLNEPLYNEHRLWPYWQQYVESHPEEFFLD
jgi:hypothetical protein